MHIEWYFVNGDFMHEKSYDYVCLSETNKISTKNNSTKYTMNYGEYDASHFCEYAQTSKNLDRCSCFVFKAKIRFQL